MEEPGRALPAYRLEEISHTADLGYRIRASSLAGLFAAAPELVARALGIPGSGAGRSGREKLELRRPDRERLLVALIAELLGEAVLRRASPRLDELQVARVEPNEAGREASGWRLVARLGWSDWPRDVGPEREVKGVTYHGLEVVRTGDDGWRATVVLDV